VSKRPVNAIFGIENVVLGHKLDFSINLPLIYLAPSIEIPLGMPDGKGWMDRKVIISRE
jgi:hypothetical protein